MGSQLLTEVARAQVAHQEKDGNAWSGRLRGGARAVPTWLWVLAFYLLMAVVTIGRHAIAHPRHICACVGSQDPAAYMWALSWWPHALAHGLNPFVTHYLWSPTGVNVAQGAMIPTAALVMAPVTELVGPIASYNALSIASPMLAALTAYLLCRRIAGRELPAVVGGYLFGFGAYEFAQLTGHLNLTLVFLIPVMVHLALRRLDREITRRAYVIWMAVLFVLQAGLSTELLADALGLGLVAVVAARFLVSKSRRSLIDGLLAETLGGGLIALVLASPFIYYALFSGAFPTGAANLSDAYGLDLLNPLFPTYSTWLGHHDFLSLGLTYEGQNVSEADGYLGIPIVLAFILWAVGARRTLLARMVVIVAAVSVVAALGSHLHVAGQQTMALPFNWFRDLPIFDNIVPSRIVLFTALMVSIGIASWLSMPTGRSIGRWLLVVAGAVAIFPNLLVGLYGTPPVNPRFFSTAMYRRYLKPGETILALPFGERDVSMLWQAETGFYFYMPEGYVSGVVPSPFNIQPTTGALILNVPPSAPAFEAFVEEHYVSHVVVDTTNAGPWPAFLSQIGLHGHQVGGVLLYAVPSLRSTHRTPPKASKTA
jgi:hypothetical protein